MIQIGHRYVARNPPPDTLQGGYFKGTIVVVGINEAFGTLAFESSRYPGITQSIEIKDFVRIFKEID